MDNVIYTGSENEQRKDDELAELQAKAAMVVGGSSLGVGIASHFIDKNEQARNILSKLPGANRYSKKYDLARAHAIANGAIPVDLKQIYANQSSQRSALSILSSIEELSPMGVLKTLQLSNLIEPFTKMTANETPDIKITSTSLKANEDFYRSMLKRNGIVLKDSHLENGFLIRKGELFTIDKDGNIINNDPLLRNVKITTSHVKMGERVSPNRVLQKYANIQGSSLGHNGFHLTQTVFIGDNNKARLLRDWTRAYVRQGMEIGFKTMDNPLGGLEDILKATGIENLPFGNTSWYKSLKSRLNVNLGTGGRYDLSTRESIKLMAKNSTVKLGGLYLGYQGLNHILNKTTDENSIWHNGLLAGATHLYAGARVTTAKVLADPFQRYKENQEAAAEGSTSLLTLAGFPIAGATLGASLSYYKRLADTAKDGLEKATARSETEAGHGLADKLFKRMGIKNMAPYKSNALKGALLGGLVALPFLPGALIGESSEELKAKYSGEKQVENRANRWWLMGGNRYEGDHIKNYQSSMVHRLKNNPELHALYKGDMGKKLDDDPLYSPLKYLKNPYRKEMATQDSSPYPVWGMEVTTGSFLGKLFQGTVGEIIKPTRLSPQMKAQMAQGGQAANNEAVQKGVGETDGDVTVVSTADGAGYKLATKKGLEQSSGKGAPPAIRNPDGSYSVKTTVRPKDQKLIEADMMLRDDDAHVNQVSQPLKKSYSAIGDFVGLKGFIGNTILNSMGINLEESKRQLARSGQGNTLAKLINDQNLGDIGGLGEFQRRIVPTSSSSKQDTVNPLRNKVAPSWLPQDESKYYIDFGKGDYWTKVANAQSRLPGEGYASLNPSLKGVNPENYPLAHKFKILSDVASGSEQQIAMRKQLLAKVTAGEITGEDKELFYKTLEQEQNKAKKKKFNEYLTDDQKKNLSFTGKLLNKLWETAAHHSENPLEPITPFRPASKFIHQRSAIEDYNKTMLQGPDSGIWTSPYSHFVRVAWNRSKDAIMPGVQKPKESIQRDNLEEYFDKLSYLKARRSGNMNEALKTTVGRSHAGIYDRDSMNKFKAGLSKDQQAYVESFAKEADPKKRQEILKMLPKHIGDSYMDIWKTTAVAEKAKASGQNVNEAIKRDHIETTKMYEKQYDIKLKGEKRTSNLELEFNKSLEKRLKVADIEAEKYVQQRTGVPSKKWIGWDPRLTMDDIKLRTLTVGKADIHRYGFWKPDQERNDRIVALNEDKEIADKYREIKRILRDTNVQKETIRRQMLEKGIVANRIELTPASRNDVRVAVKQSEM